MGYIDSKKLIGFFPAYATWPIARLENDFIISTLNTGSVIHYYRCVGDSSFCPSNSFFLKNIKIKKKCHDCVAYSDNLKIVEKLANDNFKIIDLKVDAEACNIIDNHVSIINNLFNNNNIKNIEKYLDGLDIDLFQSVTSTMITRLECESPNIYTHKELFIGIFKSALEYDSMVKSISSNYSYDKVYIFNGRQARYRSILRHFKKNSNCEVYTYEYPIISNNNLLIVKDNYGHDQVNFSKQLYNFSKNDLNISDAELNWANNYYELRVSGGSDSIDGSYVRNQVPGFLNEDIYSAAERVISYFYSSQYDLANIKEKIESSELTQIEIIEILASEFSEYKIVVRMHPNMSYYEDFYLSNPIYKKYKNIIVVPPSSKLSSYELVRFSKAIVTYGSTIGCEAAFLQKFNILVGSAPYMSFGVSTIVKNKSQLIDTLANYLSKTIIHDSSAAKVNAVLYAIAVKNFGHIINNSSDRFFTHNYKYGNINFYIFKYKFWRYSNLSFIFDIAHKLSIKYSRLIAKRNSV